MRVTFGLIVHETTRKSKAESLMMAALVFSVVRFGNVSPWGN